MRGNIVRHVVREKRLAMHPQELPHGPELKQKVHDPFCLIHVFGWLERIELSTPLPQSGVLPLNYSHHKFFAFIFVKLVCGYPQTHILTNTLLPLMLQRFFCYTRKWLEGRAVAYLYMSMSATARF